MASLQFNPDQPQSEIHSPKTERIHEYGNQYVKAARFLLDTDASDLTKKVSKP